MAKISSPNPAGDGGHAYLRSLFYEQLVEHVFVSEVLQEAWYRFGETVEVLRSEVDASGYDLVFECNGVLRHVQLKTSKSDGKTQRQNVNVALATKPGGCVVWLVRHEDRATCRMRLSYLFFGGNCGERLPSLDGLAAARHTRGPAGAKPFRDAIRVVPKSRFEVVDNTRELVGRLFGIAGAAND